MINEATPEGFFAWLNAQPPRAHFNDRADSNNALARYLNEINPHIQRRIACREDVVTFGLIRRPWCYLDENPDPDAWRRPSLFELRLMHALGRFPASQTAAQLQKRLNDLRPTEIDNDNK